jgi:hypothetical protein
MTENEAEIVAVALAHAATILAGQLTDRQLDELLDDQAGQAAPVITKAGSVTIPYQARAARLPSRLGQWRY